MKQTKNSTGRIDKSILKYNPRFSELLKDVRPTDYKKSYRLLKGRLVTSHVDQKTNALIFNGSRNQLDRIISGSRSKTKHGLFMTIQESKDIAQWSGEGNIKKLDSILIEFDRSHLLDEQIVTILTSKLPYTMMVFSGNKSIHTLVIFDTAISFEEMSDFREKLSKIFPTADRAVLSSLNCFFRLPISDEFYFQPLLKFNGMVSRSTFVSWLNKSYLSHSNARRDSPVPFLRNNSGLSITINGNVNISKNL